MHFLPIIPGVAESNIFIYVFLGVFVSFETHSHFASRGREKKNIRKGAGGGEVNEDKEKERKAKRGKELNVREGVLA